MGVWAREKAFDCLLANKLIAGRCWNNLGEIQSIKKDKIPIDSGLT